MPHPASKAKVLIIAREAVIAALIGMLLELEGYMPVYAQTGERPEDALARVRPPLVVVLDGGLESARSDLFYTRAVMSRAKVVLFSEPFAAEDIRAMARDRRVPFFAMPVDRATLADVVSLAHRGEERPRGGDAS
jgi:DNA-binding NtrC family response regulator